MGDTTAYEFGFSSRAAALLKSGTFSDVDIQVIDGSNFKSFKAHKLFLAMGSKVFGEIFFNQNESPDVYKIFDFHPRTVNLMLNFLYSDRVNGINAENARELYRLAKRYEINHLEKYCISCFTKNEITEKNVFEMYKFALSEKISELLDVCRNLVSLKALGLFKSLKFTEASEVVVDDIFRLDSLNVKSEMEVINAAIEWAKHESYRRNESARICMWPLLKNIRFLTLTAPEFCDFLENNKTLLNSHESAVLTMAIIQPQSNIQLPSGFSCDTRHREYTNLLSLASLKDNLDESYTKPSENTKHIDFDLTIKEHLQDNFGLLPEKNKNMDQKTFIPKQFLEYKKPPAIENTVFSEKSSLYSLNTGFNDDPFPDPDNNYTLLDQYKKPSPPSSVYKRSDSVPISVRKQTPLLKVTPQIPMGQRRMFDFPLIEFEKEMCSAFPSDIICSANIFLSRGTIEIYGIELKIRPSQSFDETIMAHVILKGSNYPTKSKSYTEKLNNYLCPITFEEPLKLCPKQNIRIEVTIEDIILSRIPGFQAEKCELNCGLQVNAEITMKSNQATNERSGFFYVISRLIYKPC